MIRSPVNILTLLILFSCILTVKVPFLILLSPITYTSIIGLLNLATHLTWFIVVTGCIFILKRRKWGYALVVFGTLLMVLGWAWFYIPIVLNPFFNALTLTGKLVLMASTNLIVVLLLGFFLSREKFSKNAV